MRQNRLRPSECDKSGERFATLEETREANLEGSVWSEVGVTPVWWIEAECVNYKTSVFTNRYSKFDRRISAHFLTRSQKKICPFSTQPVSFASSLSRSFLAIMMSSDDVPPPEGVAHIVAAHTSRITQVTQFHQRAHNFSPPTIVFYFF